MDKQLVGAEAMDRELAAPQRYTGINPDSIRMLAERYEHISEFPGVSKDTAKALEQVVEDLRDLLDTRDYR